MNTTIGLFQVAYQGSPVSSWADVGYGNGGAVEGTYIWGRGNWVDATVDGSGNTILGSVHSKRTPWYTQTDLNLTHAFKVNKNNEAQQLSFTANVLNLFNQHAVIAYWQGVNSDYNPSSLFMFQPFLAPPLGGAGFYQQVETGYNPQTVISTGQPLGIPIPLNAQYGQPNQWQLARNLRLAVKFTW
jgi:hypothetical protein